ncbi:MAG: caspase family protein [Saprospiraceae bacterium]|nr:MAG: caspase family protein [Saprospiraceae bacterium]
MNTGETKLALKGSHHNYVLAIAIDTYKFHSPLQNPVKDCEALLGVLSLRYEFDLEKDNFKFLRTSTATKKEIYKAFRQYQPSIDGSRKGLTTNENLLVIFSGHGHFDPGQGMGFWVPFEAETGEEAFGSDFIANSDILSWLNACGAYQITLIADTCFSGSLLSTDAGIGYRLKNSLPAPYVLASGRVQEVSDGYNMSPFIQRLIATLKAHEKGALFLQDIGKQVLTSYEWKTNQTP